LDLKRRAFAGIDAKRRRAPPAGLDEFQVKHRFENEKSGEVAAGDLALGDAGLRRGAALDSAPELTRAVHGRGWREYKDALGAVLLKEFQIVGREFTIEAGDRPTGNEDGVGGTGDDGHAGREPFRKRASDCAMRVTG